MDTTHQGDRNKKSSRWKFLGKKTKSHANAPDPVTRDSGYGTSDHYPSGASSVGDNEHTYDQPQVGDELEDPDTGEVVVVTTTTTTTTTTSTRGGKQREIPTQEIVRDVRTEETRIPAGASGPHHNATINQSNLPVFEHVSSRGNDIHDATTTLTHAPVTTGTTTGVSGPIDEPYATHSTTDSPAIPEKSSKRLSQDYTRPAPITDPAAGIDTPPSPNRHNFSYPSRQAPGTHQHTSGYDNDPVSPISTATTQPGSAMDAHNRYRPQQSTLSNLKSAAAGIHGVGETLRGTLNSSIDRRFGNNPAVNAKNQAVIDAGRSEIESGRFHQSVKDREIGRWRRADGKYVDKNSNVISEHSNLHPNNTGGVNTNANNSYDNPSSTTTYGPHGSNMANKADPRVDSDRDGRGAFGSNIGSTNYGPHSSNIANKADPRVDSNLDGSRTTGNTGPGGYTSNTNTSGPGGYTHMGSNTSTSGPGGYGNTTTSGPHNSNLANKADPRVDSDRDSRSGFGKTTGPGGYGSTTDNTTAGPHNSNLANKADPRVDSDHDGKSGFGNTSGASSGVGSHDYASTPTNATGSSEPFHDYNTNTTEERKPGLMSKILRKPVNQRTNQSGPSELDASGGGSGVQYRS